MSKVWIIKICEDDYDFGYIGGWDSNELGCNVKLFLKDHPEGKVNYFLLS